MGEERLGGMRIGVPRESRARETRVAATPSTVAALRRLGHEVLIGAGAGRASSFADEAYAEAGAQVVPDGEAWGADVVLRINTPASAALARLADGPVLISQLAPALAPDLVQRLARRPITALAMDAVP